MNMRGFLSSIPPFVYQFMGAPFAHSNVDRELSGSLREWKLLILLLLPWPFWIKVSWIAVGCSAVVFGFCLGFWVLVVAVWSKTHGEWLCVFAKMLKNVKCWSWNSKWQEAVFFQTPIFDWKGFHGGFELSFTRAVWCVRENPWCTVLKQKAAAGERCKYKVNYCKSRWWFQIFLNVHPYLRKILQFDHIIFIRWVGSTTNQKLVSILFQESILLFESPFFWSYGAPFQTFSNGWPFMFLSHFEYTVLSVFFW